jgi:SAM-dependent methyltransferase
MLDVFHRRLTNTRGNLLVLADAEQPWPVQDRTTTLVFASRVAHLLDPARLRDELRRVCRPGGYFLIGRIAREPNTMRSRLRDERLRLLSRSGAPRRGSGEGGQRLLGQFVASGCTPVAKCSVATWSTATSAQRILSDWEAMGPAELPFDVLREWARQELGDLNRVETDVERYTLEGVRLTWAAADHEPQLSTSA